MPYYRHDPQSQYVVNFNLDQEQAQRPVRRRHLPHGAEPGAGGVHHRGLRRAGRIRVRPRDHGALRGRRSGDRQLRADLEGSRYNSVAAFLIGQAAAPAERCRCPTSTRAGHGCTASNPGSLDPSDNLTLDVGTRWEYFPIPTRPDRGIERYDVATNKVCSAASATCPKDCGIERARRASPRVLARRIASARSGSPARATG